ncbi:glycosyltransferase [Bacillus lacus]|uniref:Glycosyltransferase n=1 Tax=Metabacillus lacus TaxID=1983721 RepID=A0A7X2J2P6_9BACI|nr:glycosyltransferase family 2 protein [Metabacillus lacus]MRX74189.1 glycosyltransferase [Metabacillus lacus]
MIVKNESRIIERCLNAAKKAIDYVSVCDTGSTDGTPDLIKAWCEENAIEGVVHHEPFKNFGHNRTLSVQLAQQSFPQADYLLLLDADMILEIHEQFDKSNLDQDQYLVMQFNQFIKYWNTRLLKSSLPWRCVGVTHEYWDIDADKLKIDGSSFALQKGNVKELVINDREDGGSKSDKFERDKRLLHEGLEDPATPDGLRTRYLFYLAQTYYCLGELQDAIEWYKKRVEAGGWAEEVFYSLMQVGLSYQQLAGRAEEERKLIINAGEEVSSKVLTALADAQEKNAAMAASYYKKSYQFRPWRAEPLYFLAKMHRENAENSLALLYAIKGKEIPFPQDDLLFVDYRVYEYLFDYEISIAGYYVPEKRELAKLAQKSLEGKVDSLPANIADVVKRNSQFY